MKHKPNIKRLFQNEMMTCHLCGKKQRANPKVESGWTALQIEDEQEIRYYCVQCWDKIIDEVAKLT